MPFYPPHSQPKKSDFKKNEKNTWRYYHFTQQVYHKWQSYDVCFPEIWSMMTEFLVILDRFLHFYPPPDKPKNQNFEKLKKKKQKKKTTCLEISSLYNSLPKIIIICYTVPEIWHLGYFLLFHLPNSPKNQN